MNIMGSFLIAGIILFIVIAFMMYKKMLTVKDVILLLGWVGMITQALMFLVIFVLAFLNPTKMVTVNINKIKEANLELFLNMLFLPCQVYLMAKVTKLMKKRVI